MPTLIGGYTCYRQEEEYTNHVAGQLFYSLDVRGMWRLVSHTWDWEGKSYLGTLVLVVEILKWRYNTWAGWQSGV